MLYPNTNVGELRNDVLMTIFTYFQNSHQKSWNLTITKIFYFLAKFFYLKSFVVSNKMGSPLEYMVLMVICINLPGYYLIHGNKCPFSL